MNAGSHQPVMLEEVVAALAPQSGEIHLDGTFGAGGYTRALLERADCRVIAFDRDPTAIEAGRELEAAFKGRLTLQLAPFSELVSCLDALGIELVDGVVFDLGVSSMQLDRPERGFSFAKDGPLDMRMSMRGETAADVVNSLPERELADVIYRFGEERRSRAVAGAIVAARKIAPIETTGRLAEIVAGVVRQSGRIHPATRTFQALRIYVNREIEELLRGLEAAEHALAEGGRLVVVSFHSLEDREAKRFLQSRSAVKAGVSRHLPQQDSGPEPTFRLPRRSVLKPRDDEIRRNPRARSARLRAAVRTAAPARRGLAA
jgi:16S rRNA (cytosine1402-N4)-methyltransferase